jgi:hypothetical protein
MTEYNYHNRRFRGLENYDEGDLTQEVVFHYTQSGSVVKGTFAGGRVTDGSLLAEVFADGRLDMIWRYRNVDGQDCYGTCTSTPEILPDGRYRLHEKWTITGGPLTGESGTSSIEEIAEEEMA